MKFLEERFGQEGVVLKDDSLAGILLWSYLNFWIIKNQGWYDKKYPNIFVSLRKLFIDNEHYHTLEFFQQQLPETYKADLIQQLNKLTMTRQSKKVQFYESNAKITRLH